MTVKSTSSNEITGAIAILGGAAAVAIVGGGIGVVGAFGAVGIGAVEIFTGGALLSGAAAHTAQKKLSSKPKSKKSVVPSRRPTLATVSSQEIIDLQKGVF